MPPYTVRRLRNLRDITRRFIDALEDAQDELPDAAGAEEVYGQLACAVDPGAGSPGTPQAILAEVLTALDRRQR
jgi:hypothetical protein